MHHLALLSDPWWGLGCVPCGGVGGEGWDHRGTKSGAPQLRSMWLDSYDMWWSISEIDLDSDDQWWCVVSLRLGPLCLSSLPAWRVYQATNAAFMATTKIKRMSDRISELKQQLAATKAELDRYKKMAGLTGLQSWCGMYLKACLKVNKMPHAHALSGASACQTSSLNMAFGCFWHEDPFDGSATPDVLMSNDYQGKLKDFPLLNVGPGLPADPDQVAVLQLEPISLGRCMQMTCSRARWISPSAIELVAAF